MNERKLRRLFPGISTDVVAANCGVLPSKPSESSETLDGGSEREETGVVRPIVRFTRRGRRELDSDNLAACFKDLLDGLKLSHLIIDDSPKYIEAQYRQKLVGPRDIEHTVIEIYYP